MRLLIKNIGTSFFAGFVFIALALFIISFSSKPAAAFELGYIDEQANPVFSMSGEAAGKGLALGDKCLSLLNVSYNKRQHSDIRHKQNIGKSAAIGLVFGLRFALGPKEVLKNTRAKDIELDVWSPRDSASSDIIQVAAVSQYRRCKKEETLNALNDFRWQR